jgi:aspartate ammonia-lyase
MYNDDRRNHITAESTYARPTRLESASMGTVAVPVNVYWGAQPTRSLIHFSIGHERKQGLAFYARQTPLCY